MLERLAPAKAAPSVGSLLDRVPCLALLVGAETCDLERDALTVIELVKHVDLTRPRPGVTQHPGAAKDALHSLGGCFLLVVRAGHRPALLSSSDE
jgi:hypothetical protein